MNNKNIIRSKLDNNFNIIKEIDTGVEESYIIKSDKKYFIKFLESGHFKPAGFIAGAKLLDMIDNKTSVPVPSLYMTHFDIKEYNKTPFYITEYVSGEKMNGYDTSLSSDFYKNLFSELGSYIGEYNNISINCDQYGWAGWFNNKIDTFGGHDRFVEFLIQRIKDSINKIEPSNPMHPLKSDIQDKIKNIKNLNLNFTEPCLVNHDIKFQNILFNNYNDQNTIKSIVDWDNPIIGTIHYNIAKFERHFCTDYCKKSYQDLIYFNNFISAYFNKIDNTDSDILDSKEMNICRLEDYIDVSKHFNNYYSHLNDKERDKAKKYYHNNIRDILSTI